MTRWQGNSGRGEHLPERDGAKENSPGRGVDAGGIRGETGGAAGAADREKRIPSPAAAPRSRSDRDGGLGFPAAGLGLRLPQMDTEDLLLGLILYLLYRESGDQDWIIMLISMMIQ